MSDIYLNDPRPDYPPEWDEPDDEPHDDSDENCIDDFSSDIWD